MHDCIICITGCICTDGVEKELYKEEVRELTMNVLRNCLGLMEERELEDDLKHFKKTKTAP